MLKCVPVDGDTLQLKYAKRMEHVYQEPFTKPHCSSIQLSAGTIIS